MVYQLEKKYFPDQSLDKAFLQPGQSNVNAANVNVDADGKGEGRKKGVGVDEKLVFFEGKEKGEEGERGSREVKEKKVEEFFKGLKKVPGSGKDVQVGEPFLSSRRTGLPPVWDSPHGTVVLVNKPKGQLNITHYTTFISVLHDETVVTCALWNRWCKMHARFILGRGETITWFWTYG